MFVVNGVDTEDLSPPGRVYRQKLPEWSLDVNGFSPRQNVKDWAASCNIRGYINFPVFEPDSGACVGVLELVTSSKYVDYAFEVREVSRALKEVNLKSPIVFEDPGFYAQIQIADERRQLELNEIFYFLKAVCDIQNIPLAQTWALSGYSSVVSNSGKLERSCSSYNSKCIGKVCMSTYDLPHYVRDLSMWGYRVACKETHLEKSRGIVGRSLASRITYFCRDVTKLDKDEYPLVPYARLNGITSCLAVYLKSIERDVEYVIEFVLPPHSANGEGLQSLVKTLKDQVENASWVQLGNLLSFQVIGELPFSWSLESPPETRNQRQLFENERKPEHVASFKKQSHVHYVEHVGDNMKNEPANSTSVGTEQSVVHCFEAGINESNRPTRKRKITDQSVGLEKIRKHYRKTYDKHADISPVSRSGNHDLAASVLHQPDIQPEITITEQFIESEVKILTIKATYKENMVKFPLRLSDGLVKLKELIAERFPLGSFKLKYKDEDGDMIWISCDDSLMETIAEFTQPDGQTVIRLFVLPDA
ncbi:NIN-like protein [Artemisia annua]|uniref:NIN-like protein n=1 Tax=Artemisia annua TaxID=35608 RepID=A0A2U1QHG6_ARTAN|nr:NIN-like protein [Artemisia annua]